MSTTIDSKVRNRAVRGVRKTHGSFRLANLLTTRATIGVNIRSATTPQRRKTKVRKNSALVVNETR